MPDVSAIVKAYDVRGIVGEQLDTEVAERLGRAAAIELHGGAIVVARDMRPSGVELSEAFMAGVRAQGVDTVDIGLASTDLLYYASGRLGLPGAMWTASHNPVEYNGLKLCREKAAPIGRDSGLAEIRELAEKADGSNGREPGPQEELDILSRYADHCRAQVEVSALRPLKVAVDAGNGMAGKTVPAVFEPLPFRVLPLYFELDGTFPNHLANPIEPENVKDLQRTVLEQRCDLGVAFDGDADRMFLIDERGQFVGGDMVTAMVSVSMLKKHPDAAIVYNLVSSRGVPETIARHGGRPIRSRVAASMPTTTKRSKPVPVSSTMPSAP